MSAFDIPGYGEAISDPARLPPYDEDLGGGVTHKVTADGSDIWYKDGALHRDSDLPAVAFSDGYKAWYKHGALHRDGDLPAVVDRFRMLWYRNGYIHRDGDKPATTFLGWSAKDSYGYWYRDGKLHRDGDLPAIIAPNGYQAWAVDGLFSRKDGPQVISSAERRPNGYWFNVPTAAVTSRSFYINLWRKRERGVVSRKLNPVEVRKWKYKI